MHCSRLFAGVVSFYLHSALWSQYYYLHVMDEGVRLTEVERFDQSHMTGKGQNPDFNSCFSEIKVHIPPSALCASISREKYLPRNIKLQPCDRHWIRWYMIPLNLHKNSFDVNFICILKKSFLRLCFLERWWQTH